MTICRKIRLRGQTEVSANSRAGHKFNLDQVVDYGPKGASKFSKAWANAVAFAEWAEARQHEEAIARALQS